MKLYNKLVRDNIPDIMKKNGANPVIRILNNDEYLVELNKKLQEEVLEYLENEDIEELADIYEVILAILKVKNVSNDSFEETRKQKVLKRGSFNNKIFLESEE